MPTYEYACLSCGHHIEVYQRFSDESLTVCGVCGGPLRKVFHPAGILFKGSGFYATDSRSSRSGGGGEAAKGGSSEGAGPGTSGSGTSASGDGAASGKGTASSDEAASGSKGKGRADTKASSSGTKEKSA